MLQVFIQNILISDVCCKCVYLDLEVAIHICCKHMFVNVLPIFRRMLQK
jgi:hypothetical protein